MLEVVVVGGIIAPTTKPTVGELSVDGRTGQSGAPAMSPNRKGSNGFDRWSCDILGHRTVRCRTGQALFIVRCAFLRCFDSARTIRALFTLQATVGVDRCAR
jgi:hypothetical protein